MTVYRRQPSNLAAPSVHAHGFDDVDVPGDWVYDAACARVDPAIFYRDEHDDGHSAHTQQAKKVCAGCPVTAECLAYAIAHEGPRRNTSRAAEGVWGGKTAAERRRIIVARDKAAS